MFEQSLLYGVKVPEAVDEKHAWFVRLKPVFSANRYSSQLLLPEPVPFDEDSFVSVYGWTEHALAEMDRLGVPLVPELHGPLLLPSAEEGLAGTVQVWVSCKYAAGDGNIIWRSAMKIVDAWMDGEVADLTADDKAFLAMHYPPFRTDKSAEYDEAVKKLLRTSRAA
jgi:hypothetical protein